MKKKLITTIIILATATLIAGCGDKKIDKSEGESSAVPQVEEVKEESEKVDLSVYKVEEIKAKTVMASSILKDGHGIAYDPILITDNDSDTAWVEGAKDNGVNESITLDFGKEVMVKELSLINGYTKTAKNYYANNRVKKVKLEFSDGSTVVGDLEDGISSSQIIKLENGIKTSNVKITILDVYGGDKYQDTCIAEVDVKGYADVSELVDGDIKELASKEFTATTIAKEEIHRPEVKKAESAEIFTEDDAEELLRLYYKNKGVDTTDYLFLFEGRAVGNMDGYEVVVQ